MGLFSNRNLVIKFNKIFDTAIIPTKAHTGVFQDAAFDLFALSTADVVLLPGERKIVSTGLRAILPEGYWVKFHERSGLAAKGVHVMGGVIDTAYTGEWKVVLYNSNSETVTIDPGKAICQFTLEKVLNVELQLIAFNKFKSLSDKRLRGTDGFGSTDTKKKT